MSAFADRNERNPNLPGTVEVAVCVIARDRKQSLAFEELLYPRTIPFAKTIVEHAIEQLKPRHSIFSQILVSPDTSPEQESL